MKETIEIETPSISCNGGGGALGHPQVYLTVVESGPRKDTVDCPYCGRHFVFVAARIKAAAH